MAQSVHEWNERNIAEFRERGGKIGGPFEGRPVLLLTHTGAKSGVRRTNPLVCLPEGDTIYIIGSKGGAPRHPDWYYNLRANPIVTVEFGTETFEAEASELTGEERDRAYALASEVFPPFVQYQRNTSRKIPVFALRRRAGKSATGD